MMRLRHKPSRAAAWVNRFISFSFDAGSHGVRRLSPRESVAAPQKRALAERFRREGIDIAESTGINRMTLSRMTNVRGYGTSTDTIDKLCKYFGCQVGDVAQYVDEADAAPAAKAATSASPIKAARFRTASSKVPTKRKKA